MAERSVANSLTPLTIAEDSGTLFRRRDRVTARLHKRAIAALQMELLGRIHAVPFKFFEQLIIDVLVACGYCVQIRDLARRVGKRGDGGVDGVIPLDELELDVIHLQAKRLRPGTTVPISDIRDFAGSLEFFRASKGVFVTTAHFRAAAPEFVQAVSRHVVLVDGDALTSLVIRHDIGVRLRQTYSIKETNSTYFSRGNL